MLVADMQVGGCIAGNKKVADKEAAGGSTEACKMPETCQGEQAPAHLLEEHKRCANQQRPIIARL